VLLLRQEQGRRP